MYHTGKQHAYSQAYLAIICLLRQSVQGRRQAHVCLLTSFTGGNQMAMSSHNTEFSGLRITGWGGTSQHSGVRSRRTRNSRSSTFKPLSELQARLVSQTTSHGGREQDQRHCAAFCSTPTLSKETQPFPGCD